MNLELLLVLLLLEASTVQSYLFTVHLSRPSYHRGMRVRCTQHEETPISPTNNHNIDPACVRYFINLTNGIEAIDVLRKRGVTMDQINYFRLQSTHCESRNYQAILENLDNNMLMSLALGYIVVLFDYGCRGSKVEDHRDGIPRSYWWGVEWITYCLNHFWDLQEGIEDPPMVRGCNTRQAFEEQVKALPKDLRRRLKYFRPFLRSNRIHLYPVYAKTDKDGEKEFYAGLLKTAVDTSLPQQGGIGQLEAMSRETVDLFVQQRVVPESMFIYRSSDFEGIGRNKFKKVTTTSATQTTNELPENGEEDSS